MQSDYLKHILYCSSILTAYIFVFSFRLTRIITRKSISKIDVLDLNSTLLLFLWIVLPQSQINPQQAKNNLMETTLDNKWTILNFVEILERNIHQIMYFISKILIFSFVFTLHNVRLFDLITELIYLNELAITVCDSYILRLGRSRSWGGRFAWSILFYKYGIYKYVIYEF